MGRWLGWYWAVVISEVCLVCAAAPLQLFAQLAECQIATLFTCKVRSEADASIIEDAPAELLDKGSAVVGLKAAATDTLDGRPVFAMCCLRGHF
jgi:hypothetical protein